MFKEDEKLKNYSAFALTEGRKRVAIVKMDNNIRSRYLGFLTRILKLLDNIT